jgi:hypothetical protein
VVRRDWLRTEERELDDEIGREKWSSVETGSRSLSHIHGLFRQSVSQSVTHSHNNSGRIETAKLDVGRLDNRSGRFFVTRKSNCSLATRYPLSDDCADLFDDLGSAAERQDKERRERAVKVKVKVTIATR